MPHGYGFCQAGSSNVVLVLLKWEVWVSIDCSTTLLQEQNSQLQGKRKFWGVCPGIREGIRLWKCGLLPFLIQLDRMEASESRGQALGPVDP